MEKIKILICKTLGERGGVSIMEGFSGRWERCDIIQGADGIPAVSTVAVSMSVCVFVYVCVMFTSL